MLKQLHQVLTLAVLGILKNTLHEWKRAGCMVRFQCNDHFRDVVIPLFIASAASECDLVLAKALGKRLIRKVMILDDD